MEQKQIALRIGTIVAAGIGVFVAEQQEAQAWVAGASYYEECNIDFHVPLTDLDVLSCSTEELQETYVNGSYKEECYGEGCNTEERYELSEGRGSNGKTERVHNYMLNTFCLIRTSPSSKGYVRGVHPGHLKAVWPGNLFCYDVGGAVCSTLEAVVPGVCEM